MAAAKLARWPRTICRRRDLKAAAMPMAPAKTLAAIGAVEGSPFDRLRPWLKKALIFKAMASR